MAPVVQAPAASYELEARVCVTAQHANMLDYVLALFGVTPKYEERAGATPVVLAAAASTDIHVTLVDHREFCEAPSPSGVIVDALGAWRTEGGRR